MSTEFYTLRVSKIKKETHDSTSVYFELPENLKDTFKYKAGQYLTLKFDVNGQEYRRAYSIFTSPLGSEIGVTTKRVVGGVISNYINDQIDAGSDIEVMPPQGKFVLKLDPANSMDYYMFAGGSGITPMMSIIQAVLEQEPKSVCHLLYANRDEESIIFKDVLTSLEDKYKGQLRIRNILSSPKTEKKGGITGLFSKAKASWTGWSGFPDQAKVSSFINEEEAHGSGQKYLICGPGPMMDLVMKGLEGLGKSKSDIMIEYFASPDEENKDSKGQAVADASTSGLIKVHLKKDLIEIDVPQDKTILDTLIDAGYDPPYSCTSGACSTCVAKVLSGEVSMEVCYALDDDEVAEGYILTCQAHPTSDNVEIKFEN